MKQTLKSKEQVDFAIFTFAQSSGIDDTMVALQRSGINIRGVFDGLQGNQSWAATRLVHKAGCEVYLVPHQKGVNKLHHKLMVIDRQVVIAGSFNYTGPANALNDENIIVIGDLGLGEADAVVRERQEKIGNYALREIDRIIRDYGKRVQ